MAEPACLTFVGIVARFPFWMCLSLAEAAGSIHPNVFTSSFCLEKSPAIFQPPPPDSWATPSFTSKNPSALFGSVFMGHPPEKPPIWGGRWGGFLGQQVPRVEKELQESPAEAAEVSLHGVDAFHHLASGKHGHLTWESPRLFVLRPGITPSLKITLF